MRHEPTSGYEDPSLNYRVTWKYYGNSGQVSERIFTSRDDGWDFYQDLKKSADAFGATWEHVPSQ